MFLREVGFKLEGRSVAACGSIHPWLKPFDHRMYILDEIKLIWLGLMLRNTLTKDEHEIPKWVGQPAWDFSLFGPNLYTEFLHSNIHQNLWNSLVQVNLAI